MKIIPFLILTFLLAAVLNSCSTSDQTTIKNEKADEDSVYVFDEVPADTLTVKQPEEPAVLVSKSYFVIQIGAFNSEEKASNFAELARQKLNREVIIIFSNDVNLYVVQLTEPFKNKSEAEIVRNELWAQPEFKDAWILTVNK